MRIIALEGISPLPWRNGGGLTRLLASGRLGRSPEPHDADCFDWRVSLADIAADGPFSSFPDVDRHAVLLGGGAVELSGQPGIMRALPLAPVSFPGELALCARRQPGTSQPRFLNLMVRRAVLRGELRVIDAACHVDNAVACLLLPVEGSWQVQGLPDLAPGFCAFATDVAALTARPLTVGASAVLVRVHSS